MPFFLVLFLGIAVIVINRFSKRELIRREKFLFRQSFEKPLAEVDEKVMVRAEYRNLSRLSIRKAYTVSLIDKNLTLLDDPRLLSEKRDMAIVQSKLSLPAKGEKTLFIPVRAERRGVYHSYGIKAELPDFFGFQTVRGEQMQEETLVVYPKRTDNRFFHDMIVQGFGDFNAKHGFLEDETSVRSYGTYTGREPMRRINWKQSAKTGEFVVKQFEPMGTYATIIVFDVERDLYPQRRNGEMTEYCLRMLRETFEYFESKKIPYRLYTNATSPLIEDGKYECYPSGKRTRLSMLEMLGRMDLHYRGLNGIRLLDRAVKESRGAPVVYLSGYKSETVTTQIKRLALSKGCEILSLYAENYVKGGKVS